MDPSAVSTEAVRAVVAAAGGSWRDILRWVALPGFLIAVALALALPEPREAKAGGDVAGASSSIGAATSSGNGARRGLLGGWGQMQGAGPGTSAAQSTHSKTSSTASTHDAGGDSTSSSAASEGSDSRGGFLALLKTPAFLFTTLAASFNDVGSYALVAWQSTFYERIHHLEPSQYAPVLAAVLPLGGIVGGVGGGWLADFVARGEVKRDPVETGTAAVAAAGAAAGAAGAGTAAGSAVAAAVYREQASASSRASPGRSKAGRGGRGKAAASGAVGGVSRRAWVTVGASLAAAPALLVSMTTPDHEQSYVALLFGFALSEAWRAPAANMAR